MKRVKTVGKVQGYLRWDMQTNQVLTNLCFDHFRRKNCTSTGPFDLLWC